MIKEFFYEIFSTFAWIFVELFTPPYDILDIFMIICILMCVAMIFTAVRSHICLRITCRDVNRFFEEHEVSSGTVVKYEMERTNGYTVPMSVMAGSSLIVIPRTVPGGTYFTVTLDCHSAGDHFYATYKISEGDFKEYKKGERINIEDDWDPWGYEVV